MIKVINSFGLYTETSRWSAKAGDENSAAWGQHKISKDSER